MSFAEEVAAFVAKAKQTELRVYAESVHAAKASVVDGSPTTGAPGQPKASGELAASWREDIGPDEARVESDHPGAPTIEKGVREGTPIHYEAGGGPHSVALTAAAWQPLVDEVVQRVVSG